ncbi:BZ3500_MvSof-1268-A1-R1_Chr7-1g09085 [Microbotryum saponariae]|uniref:BZ3500_MvSof-1268-A1-R1_Chr7-1g09085 protein n=1 Tax=Microbotryum saponariae TaxID=289078 RepID=A0A2X0N6C7_9BASI|nr:BZ3501_MvSof-1269-A2-R1_Chr7-1g08789 [Microbotryum saponariae]SDA02772.1 BZ3500_MvSof-1268-A1-R1_Chr7-1g09085 [Microbotryum saponariae]
MSLAASREVIAADRRRHRLVQYHWHSDDAIASSKAQSHTWTWLDALNKI